MKKRYIIPLIFLLLLGLGGYWSYNFLKQTVGMGAEAISLVPKDAVFVLETEEPIKNWKDISNSAPWKFLMKNEYYKDLNKSAESLNQLIQENSKLFGDFGSRKVVMSAHVYKPSDYDYLFLIDLENISKVRPLVLSLLEELPGYKLTNRMYKETEFYSLLDTKGKQTLYLTFIDNYVVCSYTHSLVEKSIDQHVDPVIARDQKFVEVQKKVSGDGMFSLYINYQYFDDFMRVYTKSDNTYVKALSNALKYSGMEFEYDDSKALMKLNGYKKDNMLNGFDDIDYLVNVKKEIVEFAKNTPL